MTAIAMLLLVSPAVTQERAHPQSRRVVQVFDFEEQHLHDAPVPLHWFRAQHNPPSRDRPGFPIWNRAELVYGPNAHSGEGAVRLPTRGGSTALRLEPGVIPVLPGAEYTVRAMARAENLAHARPALAARFLDAQSNPLPRSEFRRVLRDADDQYRPIDLLVPETPPQAAFLQIDLELLQPDQLADERTPLFDDDLDGAVWFDDVAVILRPRVSLTTRPDGPLARTGEPPELRFSARDLVADALHQRITIYDAQGIAVATHEIDADASGAVRSWRPPLPAFGWYRAVSELSEQGATIARTAHDFAWLAPFAPDGTAPSRLGIIVPPDQSTDDLPSFLDASGFSHAVVSLWTPDLTAQTIAPRVEQIARLADALRAAGHRLILSLDRIPDEAARDAVLDPSSVLTLLARGEELVHQLLDPFLQRVGESVHAWLIVPDDPHTLAPSEALRSTEALLGSLVTSPRIASPVPPSLAALRVASPTGLTADAWLVPIDADTRPAFFEDLRALITASEPAPDPHLWLAVTPLDPAEFGPRASAADAVRRAALAISTLADHEATVLLNDPQQGPAAADASPALAALSALSTHLAARTPSAPFEPAPGVHIIVLSSQDNTRSDALIAWSDRPADAFDLLLAPGPVTRLDLFANATPLDPETPEDGAPRTHHIDLSTAPVIIEGIDAPLVLFQLQFRIRPDRLATDGSPHEHALVFSNPWPAAIEGRCFIVEPGGTLPDGRRDRSWTIEPRAAPLTIPPGEELELPLSVTMSPYQAQGTIQAVVDVEISTGQIHEPVRLRAPLRVDIDDLRIALTRPPGSPTLRIDAANLADQPRDLEITAFAEDAGRRMRTVISDLAPDSAGAARLILEASSGRLFLSIQDTLTAERINRVIDLDAAPTTAAPLANAPEHP